jgi:hypothetical protein
MEEYPPGPNDFIAGSTPRAMTLRVASCDLQARRQVIK